MTNQAQTSGPVVRRVVCKHEMKNRSALVLEVPTLTTIRYVEKAVGNTPNSEPEKDSLRENQISPLYRADSQCPPTHPHHLCCICDDAFAFEVCQGWFSCKQALCQLPSLL